MATTPDAAVPALNWDGVIPLQQILTYVRPAYGGDTWDEVFTSMAGWPSDIETIDTLLTTIGPDGLFDRAVRIGYDDEGDVWYVGNGMHRITATYLAGHASIRSATTATSDDNDDLEVIEVILTLTADSWPDDTEDALDYVTHWLRSFPLADGTWVELAIGGQFNGGLEFVWFCPHSHADQLLTELAARAARHEVTFTVDRIKLTTTERLGEDD